MIVRYRGVVGRVPAFQPRGPGSEVSGILISILCMGVSFASVVSGGDPAILLTTDSERSILLLLSIVLVYSL